MKNSIFSKGFSLIELMVVLAVIGILAAVAVPAYKNYMAKSKVSSAMVTLQYFRNEVEKYYTVLLAMYSHQVYPL